MWYLLTHTTAVQWAQNFTEGSIQPTDNTLASTLGTGTDTETY
jgi:hypothetical protein